MLELAPNDAIIKTYLQDIQRIKHDQQIAHEMGLRGPSQHLLDKAAKKQGWTLVPELSTYMRFSIIRATSSGSWVKSCA